MKDRFRWVPPPEHFFPYLRWLNIGLRGLHLVGIAGLVGGFLFDLPEARWAVYRPLTLASGGLLTGLYLWTDTAWLLKLKGQAILAKLALLGLAYAQPDWRAEVYVLAILLSAFFAHAPDRVRSWAWGRKVQPCKTATPSQRKPAMTHADIDFGELYRSHMAAAGGRQKPPEKWDARAESMGQMADRSRYVADFVGRMDLSGCETLLDVGCGTGAIALALAPRLKRVYGLDYSQGMLEVMMRKAQALGLTNVVPIRRAWEDDWTDVPVCDIVTASRSTAVMDMADALAKLDAKARRRVYLTNMVGGRFIDPEIAELLGHSRPPLPDYIYIVNILYRMGRHPRLDYIESNNRLAGAESLDAFLRKVASSVGELSEVQRARLAEWYAANPERARQGGKPFRWAFISWDVS
ncbi:MAG: class I SAM-dependent methyltransferase [Thermoanaerobaculaceae bacterium]